MASTILSDNGVSSGSAGLKSTADSTGALALQTSTAGGVATTALSISTAQVVTLTNALPVTSGGTGVTTSTGSGNTVLSTSPTLVTPILGTPTSVTLTNGTGLPLSTGVTGTLPVANGGTGLTSTPTNGQLDIGNGTGFTRTTLTPGTGISVTNASGAITITNSSPGTTYTGGTGISVAGSTITNTLPANSNIVAKAWVQFGGGITYGAGSIQGSYNVSSVTVNGTGDYTINFSSALANANYSANLSISPYGQGQANMTGQIFGYPGANFVAPTTSACRVSVTNSGFSATSNQLNCLTVFGT